MFFRTFTYSFTVCSLLSPIPQLIHTYTHTPHPYTTHPSSHPYTTHPCLPLLPRCHQLLAPVHCPYVPPEVLSYVSYPLGSTIFHSKKIVFLSKGMVLVRLRRKNCLDIVRRLLISELPSLGLSFSGTVSHKTKIIVLFVVDRRRVLLYKECVKRRSKRNVVLMSND